MNRFLVFFFFMAICIFSILIPSTLFADDSNGNAQIDTPEKAAALACELANEKAQNAFGVSPFTPESYSPRRIGSRWHWGKIEPPGIRGYSAEVEFNMDGSDPKVRTVLYTDTSYPMDLNGNRFPTLMEVIEQDSRPSESTE
jgi:hypothetical protein